MQKTFLLILISFSVQAQELDSSSFDFWLGKWSLEWVNANGDTLEGSNHVQRILGGRVIQENFTSPTAFEGKSWSVFTQSKQWTQTWVDNGGGYLEFIGGKSGDSLYFQMEPALVNDKMLVRRMVFYNIQQDSFIWNWQSAPAGTEKWRTNWQIFYEREE